MRFRSRSWLAILLLSAASPHSPASGDEKKPAASPPPASPVSGRGGSICIAPFDAASETVPGEVPNMSQSTWGPGESSRFDFRYDARHRTRLRQGERGLLEGLPLDRKFRIAIRLDGKPFETLTLDFSEKPEARLCLWLYPGYWHWVDVGWDESKGCTCPVPDRTPAPPKPEEPAR